MGVNLRELNRKERATVEAERMIMRYDLECKPPITYKLAPGEIEKLASGEKTLEECRILSIHTEDSERTVGK